MNCRLLFGLFNAKISSVMETINRLKYGTSIIVGEDTVTMLNENDLPAGWTISDFGEASSPGVSKKVKIFTMERRAAESD